MSEDLHANSDLLYAASSRSLSFNVQSLLLVFNVWRSWQSQIVSKHATFAFCRSIMWLQLTAVASLVFCSSSAITWAR